MTDSRIWNFVADMNHSGSVTISDVWLWVGWLFFYPGDFAVSLLISELPRVALFFEITYESYGGFLSGAISAWFWLFIPFVIIPEVKNLFKP